MIFEEKELVEKLKELKLNPIENVFKGIPLEKVIELYLIFNIDLYERILKIEEKIK